jgi:hypothetical protein
MVALLVHLHVVVKPMHMLLASLICAKQCPAHILPCWSRFWVMSREDVEASSPARSAILNSLHVRLADCATKLERTFHDSKDAPGLTNSISAQVKTSSLCLKHKPRHAKIEIHAADPLDLSIVVWQKHVVRTEKLTNEILHASGRAWTSGGLYAAEQERDLHVLLNALDRIQNALQVSVQLSGKVRRRRGHTSFR